MMIRERIEEKLRAAFQPVFLEVVDESYRHNVPDSSVASIVTAAEKSGLPISAIVLRQQAEQMEQTEESIYEHMRKNYQVMAECIEPGCNKDIKSTSGLTGGSAFKMRQISESGKSLTGSFLSGALYRALAVSELNAAMGRIVAAPTAGSCGILPAALPVSYTHLDVYKRQLHAHRGKSLAYDELVHAC